MFNYFKLKREITRLQDENTKLRIEKFDFVTEREELKCKIIKLTRSNDSHRKEVEELCGKIVVLKKGLRNQNEADYIRTCLKCINELLKGKNEYGQSNGDIQKYWGQIQSMSQNLGLGNILDELQGMKK